MLGALTSRTRATTDELLREARFDAATSRERHSAGEPSPSLSNGSFDINVLRFTTKIKQGIPFSPPRNRSFKLEIAFCVRGVISPLLANIYLNKLDRIWAARCGQLGKLIRYADDFVAMCRTESAAREALRRIGLVMDRLGLTLHPAKTRLVDLRRGKESFVFLGCTIRKRRSIQRNPRWHFMQRWPSPKATKKLRARIREITSKRQSGKDVKQVIAELTPVLRGWGNYFRTGNADREFNRIDTYVVRKLRRWQRRRGGQRPTKRPSFTYQQLYGMGLHRLRGTVGYPTQATPRRSSVSRVPENGMHGLKGGHMAQGCL